MNAGSHRDLLLGLGAELHEALLNGRPIDPLSKRGYDLSIADAYEIQTHMLAHRTNAGVRVVGKKIGATSEPVQKAVGIDQPDFGLLLEDGAYQSGETVPYERLIQPRAEGEIMFVLKRDLAGPGVTAEEVLDATDYVSPCLEIVDSRIRDWQIGIVDTVADNASCGVFIVGEAKVKVSDFDLPRCEMRLLRNGTLVSYGLGSASLGHPAKAVAWLANAFGALGMSLNAGEPILSGSLGDLIPVQLGDEIRVEISGIGNCAGRFL